MTIEQFRAALHAVPFQPFIVHLADGRDIPIRHRDFVAMSPSGRTFIAYRDDESHSVVDLLLVTDLEVGTNGPRNGSKKRKKG
jgi:hypothetical protein